MEHSFDIKIAKEYGIAEAIILKHIYFWVNKNALNGKNHIDGRYWTYNSVKAFVEMFPYFNERQIRYTLGKLKDEGLIMVANHNNDPRNRTLWYTLTDKAFALLGLQNQQVANDKNVKSDMPNSEAPSDKIGKCNSNNNINTTGVTDVNADVNTGKGSGGSSVVPAREQTNDGSEVNQNAEQFKSGAIAEALMLWQNNFGTLSPLLTDKIIDLVQETGTVAFEKAINKAVERNARNFSYVRAVAIGIAAGDEWEDKPPEKRKRGGRKKNDVARAAEAAQRILDSGEVIDL